MDELKARADEVEAGINVMKKAAAKQLADGSALKHAMAAHEAAVEELRGRHADIIEAAQMQQVTSAPCNLIAQDSTVRPSFRVSRISPVLSLEPTRRVWQQSHIHTLTTGSMEDCHSAYAIVPRLVLIPIQREHCCLGVCDRMGIYVMQVALPRKGDRMRTEADDEDTGHEDEADEAADEGVLWRLHIAISIVA